MSDCPPWVPYHHGIKMSVFSKADTSNNIRNAFVIRHRHEWSMIKSFLRRSPRNKGSSIQMESQATCMRKALFDQGYLDEQFIQLEDLQDDANPNFVEEVVKLYYSDSTRIIRNIELTLVKSPVDFEKLDDIMHQFKGSSSSIGANKVKRECTQFQEYCKVGNFEGCMRTFREMKQEHAALRRKLESYLELARHAR